MNRTLISFLAVVALVSSCRKEIIEKMPEIPENSKVVEEREFKNQSGVTIGIIKGYEDSEGKIYSRADSICSNELRRFGVYVHNERTLYISKNFNDKVSSKIENYLASGRRAYQDTPQCPK